MKNRVIMDLSKSSVPMQYIKNSFFLSFWEFLDNNSTSEEENVYQMLYCNCSGWAFKVEIKYPPEL